MTNQLQQVSDAEDDIISKMVTSIDVEISRLRKNPLKTAEDVSYFMAGTVLPILKDVAYYLGKTQEIALDVDLRVEQIEDGVSGEDTQFTIEDAKKFDKILQFAQMCANEQLKASDSTGLPPEAIAVLREMSSLSEECLKIVEESTLEVDDDDGEDDGDASDDGAAADTAAAQ